MLVEPAFSWRNGPGSCAQWIGILARSVQGKWVTATHEGSSDVGPALSGSSVAALTEYCVGDVPMGDALERVAELAVEAIPAARFVGITMLGSDKVGTCVYTHPSVRDVERAQYNTGDGPCCDALRTGTVMVIESTLDAVRWHEFARVAAKFGVRSTMSLPLIAGANTVGALNVYADVDAAFGPAEIDSGKHFAGQAAWLLANTQAYWDARTQCENLRAALGHRAAIEQAKGMIMAATGCSPEIAFQQLVGQSEYENLQLREIALRRVAEAQRPHHDDERNSNGNWPTVLDCQHDGPWSFRDHNEQLLHIEVHHSTSTVLYIAGELDLSTIFVLEQALHELEASGCGDLRLNLAGITFFAAAGVTTLLAARQRFALRGHHVQIYSASLSVRRVMNIVGLDHWLPSSRQSGL